MLSAGDQVGEFELIEEIGRGAMGAVWEAHQPSLSRTVAIKFLKLEHADATWMARFEAEAAQAARLSHPGILPVYAFGRHGDTPWFAMERVHGKDLADLLQASGPLDFETAARILRDAARALHHAHEQGIVHRDVKPANILLRDDGRVAVTDFGLSLEMGSGALTTTGLLVGTPYYISPEAIAGEREKVGPKADVYALGVTLYELLIGRPPFQADNALALINKISNDEPPALQATLPVAPGALDDLVRRAMAKDPADRPASAAAFADELDAFLDGATRTPAAAPPPPPAARPTPAPAAPSLVEPAPAPAGGRPPLALVVGAGILLLGLLVWLLQPGDDEPAPPAPGGPDPEASAGLDDNRAFYERAILTIRRVLGMNPNAPIPTAVRERWQRGDPVSIAIETDPPGATVEVLQLPDGGEWKRFDDAPTPPGIYRFLATAPGRHPTIWTALVPPGTRQRFQVALPPVTDATRGMLHYAGLWAPPLREPDAPALQRAERLAPYLLDPAVVTMADYSTWVEGLPRAERERMTPALRPRRGGRGRGPRRPAAAARESTDPMRALDGDQARAYARAQEKRLPTQDELAHAYLVSALAKWLAKAGDENDSGLVGRLAGHEGLVAAGRPASWVQAADGEAEAMPVEPGRLTRASRKTELAAEAALRLARDVR